jgi:hypothetical protein
MSDERIIVPELLPPAEDGVFKTLLTHPDAELWSVFFAHAHEPEHRGLL